MLVFSHQEVDKTKLSTTMIHMPLSNDKGFVIVDDSDFDLLHDYRWYKIVGRNTNYASTTWLQTPLSMHRLITGWSFVDHINGDGLDNRRENLRLSSPKLNAANVMKTKLQTSSRYKGVHKRGDKWIASIGYNYKTHYIGTYDDEESAAIAYDVAALEIFGGHARLNFVVSPRERV